MEERKDVLLDLRDILKTIERRGGTIPFILAESLIRYLQAGGKTPFGGGTPYFKLIIKKVKHLSSSFDEEKKYIGLLIKELVEMIINSESKVTNKQGN